MSTASNHTLTPRFSSSPCNSPPTSEAVDPSVAEERVHLPLVLLSEGLLDPIREGLLGHAYRVEDLAARS